MMSTLDRGLAEQKSNMSEVERRMISLRSDTHSNEKQTEQNFENIEDLRQGRADTNKRLDALEEKMKEDAAATSERLRALEEQMVMAAAITTGVMQQTQKIQQSQALASQVSQASQASRATIKKKDKKRGKERKRWEYVDILNASADVVEVECKMIDRHRQSKNGLKPMQYWVKLGLHGPYVTLNHGRYRVFNNTNTIFHRYCKRFKTNEEAREYSQAVLQLFNLYTVTRGDTFQLSWKAPNGKK